MINFAYYSLLITHCSYSSFPAMPAIPFPFFDFKLTIPGTVDLVFIQIKAVVKSFPVQHALLAAVKVIAIGMPGHGKARVWRNDQGCPGQLIIVTGSGRRTLSGNRGRAVIPFFFIGPDTAMPTTAEYHRCRKRQYRG